MNRLIKKILLNAVSLFFLSSIAFAQSYINSYEIAIFPKVRSTDIDILLTKPSDSASRTITYFDGMMRPLQIVQWQAGANGKKDVVQHFEYDDMGREATKYLLYAEENSADGAFKSNAKTNQVNYYTMNNSWDDHVVKTPHPYAVTVFEKSPLGRTLKQGAPGTIWQPSSGRSTLTGRTVEREYGTNDITGFDIVKLWRVTYSGNLQIGANSATNYAANSLYKTVSKDENWLNADGRAGTKEEYKDTDGKIVLTRIWETADIALNTYYVYDDLGNLSYVIPPTVSANSFSEQASDPIFSNYIYAYHYDARNRLKEKKVPGKGWEWLVYNASDRQVLAQDSLQRAKGQWFFIKYDGLGRSAVTGMYINTAFKSQIEAQAAVDNHSAINGEKYFWEERNLVSDYTNRAFPVSATIPQIVYYYDDYTFSGASIASLQSVGISQSSRTGALSTGIRVYTLGNTESLLTINYYDDYGRVIQQAAQNHLGGTDYVTNTYNFSGDLLITKREHKAKVGATTTILTKNEYDHFGRLLTVKHKINAQDTVLLVKNEYNEIGQLKGKSLGGNQQGGGFHSSIAYAYNERGWLKSANSPHFNYSLTYNTPSAAGSEAQYNGNIAEQHWTHKDQTTKTFIYKYDKINRLTDGNSVNGGMREGLEYDGMGNITKLTRDNHATGTSYSYIGNRLKSLTGAINTTADYIYDANGNATKDRTAMNFTYNYLNLPDSAWNNGETIKVGYLYDAMGTKLRKYSNQGGNRDYVGGIEYTGANIELIHIGEGVAFNNGGVFTYRYNLTDHLGNVRATLQRNPNSGNVEILQQDDYYPFGKQYQRLVSGTENKYLYNGKEKQSELGGGNQYDYGARFYDAEIGRWNVVDPLAEEFDNVSPYNYGMNNPILMIDPDGMASEGYLTRYIDPNGKTILNTYDGRNDVVMVPWSRMSEFLYNAYWNYQSVTTGPDARGWNDYWRNEFGIHIKESTLNYAGHYLLETEASRAAQVKYFITRSDSDHRDFLSKRLSASWNFTNVVFSMSATGTILGKSVQFGKGAEQVHHAARHLLESGLDIKTVQNAIKRDLAPNIFYQTGVRIEGKVVVDNVVVKYSGVKLPDGKINIGSIKPPR